MEMVLPPDFKEFLKLLRENSVSYLLIGGYAVGYYGYPRATSDMDVWIAMDSENAKRMVSVLKDFGFDSPELSDELFLKAGSIVRMGIPPMRIEVLTTISGVTFSECFSTRSLVQMDGTEVSIISLRDLKINKRASGRHKDLDDLENLP